MVSVPNWLKRASGGARLLPFFKCVCVYFAAAGGGGAGAVLVKCAPVLCLMVHVAVSGAQLPTAHPARRYCRLVALGLALSSVGDALLALDGLLAPGMAAFGAAHVAYCCAFGWRPLRARAGLALLAAAGLYCWLLLSPPPALAPLVPLYAALLAATTWRGGSRGGDAAGRCAAGGSLLFLASDALLGYSLFGGALPHASLLVMSSYYLAQLGIALSATLQAESAPH